MSKGDSLKWLPGAIELVERNHAAGLHNMAKDMQKCIDAAIEDGRITPEELKKAGREAWTRLPELIERERKSPWWRR
jgi:hypothetical protein